MRGKNKKQNTHETQLQIFNITGYLQLTCQQDLQASPTANPHLQQHEQPEYGQDVMWGKVMKLYNRIGKDDRSKKKGADPFRWGTIPGPIQCVELPYDHTEAENVAFLRKRLVANDLRSHPFWSPTWWWVLHGRICRDSGEPEVADLNCPVLAHETISTFKIVVDYLHSMDAHQPSSCQSRRKIESLLSSLIIS